LKTGNSWRPNAEYLSNPRIDQGSNAFQDHCEIEASTLQTCTALRAKYKTQFKEPFSVKPALTNTTSSFQGQYFVVEFFFEYTAWDASEPSERLFKIDCTFEVSYRLRDGYHPTDEEKSSFSKGTAVFNRWPYVDGIEI